LDLGDSIEFVAGSLCEVLPIWVILLLGRCRTLLGMAWFGCYRSFFFFFFVTEVLPTLPLLQQPLMQDPHPLVMQPLVQDPHHHYPLVMVKQLNLVQFPYHPMIQEGSSYDLSCAGSATT
jgi:hypothetical protein